jgi:hypothetical protein
VKGEPVATDVRVELHATEVREAHRDVGHARQGAEHAEELIAQRDGDGGKLRDAADGRFDQPVVEDVLRELVEGALESAAGGQCSRERVGNVRASARTTQILDVGLVGSIEPAAKDGAERRGEDAREELLGLSTGDGVDRHEVPFLEAAPRVAHQVVEVLDADLHR